MKAFLNQTYVFYNVDGQACLIAGVYCCALCGYSAEDSLELGFDFYQKIIHPKDLSLWTEMYKAVLRYSGNPDKRQDEYCYFSCTFRLQRKYSFSIRPLIATKQRLP